MASLLSFAFIALAFGLIDGAPVPELAYFNINPLGNIEGFAAPDVFDKLSSLIKEGYEFGLNGEPFFINNAGALGEDPAGFLDPFGLGGGIGDLIGGGAGGILDGGSGGILDGGSGGILDGGSGGILDGGSGGILDGGAGDILGGGSGGILDGGSGGILGGGSGGVLNNLVDNVNSDGTLPDGGIPAGDGTEYLIGNYDEQNSGSDSSIDYLPDGGISDGYGAEYLIGNYDESGSYSGSGSASGVPGSNTDADTVDSGDAASASYNASGSEYPSDSYDYTGPGPTDSGFETGETYEYSEYSGSQSGSADAGSSEASG